jgi:hypothetical protein
MHGLNHKFGEKPLSFNIFHRKPFKSYARKGTVAPALSARLYSGLPDPANSTLARVSGLSDSRGIWC